MRCRWLLRLELALVLGACAVNYALAQPLMNPVTVNASIERQVRGQLAVTVSNTRSEELLAFTIEAIGKFNQTGKLVILRSHFDSVANPRSAALRKGGAATIEIGSSAIEFDEIHVCGVIHVERLPATMDTCTLATMEYWVYALELARTSALRIGALSHSGAEAAEVLKALESMRDSPIEVNAPMSRVRARERILGSQIATLRSASNQNRQPGVVVAAVEALAVQARTSLESTLRPIVPGSQWEERVNRPANR